jgi:hypothetical protein
MAEVEVMTVVGGGLGVIEDGLIADGHCEDLAEHLGGFASGQGKGDMEGQDQAQQIRTAVNAGQVDGGRVRSGRMKLKGLEVILPVLITQFELGEAQLL